MEEGREGGRRPPSPFSLPPSILPPPSHPPYIGKIDWLFVIGSKLIQTRIGSNKFGYFNQKVWLDTYLPISWLFQPICF